MVKNDYYRQYSGKRFFGDYPTLQEALGISVSRYPDRVLFETTGKSARTLTFSEVARLVERIGSWLIEKGIRPGDKVALNGHNSIQWALLYISASYAGAVIVPFDNQMEPEKLRRLLAFSEAKMFFADSDVLQRTDTGDLPVFELEQVETLAPEKIRKRVRTASSDPLSMLFTSGTTGNEKAVVLTHRNIISDAFMACDSSYLDLQPEDVIFALLPLHHAYCCTTVLIEAVLNGSVCLFGQGMTPAKILSDLRSGHVTFMLAIPLIYNKFLSTALKKVREKGRWTYALTRTMMWVNGVSRKLFGINHGKVWFRPILEGLGMMDLKCAICGAGPLAAKTFRAYQQLGVDFIQGYGMTETAPVLTLNPVSNFKVRSVGRFFDDVRYRIERPDIMGIGEVVVKGPNCCEGYFKDPASTQDLFTEDGYLRTGDIGRVDRDGYLYLMGRAKNIIVTEGGKNVYPEEIEDHFQLYPQIAQVMVRGFMQNRSTKSEGIEALIYPAPDFSAGLSAEKRDEEIGNIVSSVNAKLPSYKKISSVTVLEQPMSTTTTRKIQRGKVGDVIGSFIRIL